MTTVKKKLPYELYDVAGLEDWFAQMAAEGYHLVDCWEKVAEFRVDEPRGGIRYRMEARGKASLEPRRDEAYAAAGWENVADISGFFSVFRCDDPTVEELHTDPTIQSWTMRKLIRRRSGFLLYWIIYWFFFANMRFGIALGGGVEAVNFLLQDNGVLMIYAANLLLVVHFLIVQTVQVVMLWRLKRRLAAGLPMERTKRYPRSFWMHGLQGVLLAVLIAALVVGARSIDKPWEPVDAAAYPHVTLEEVIPGGYVYVDDSAVAEGKLRTSLLAPVQFSFEDEGVYADGSEEKAQIYLYYFETFSVWSADLLMQGCMEDLTRSLRIEREWHEKYPDRFPAVVLDTGAVQTHHTGLDELWIWDYRHEGAERCRVFYGRKGSKSFALYATLPEPEAALELLGRKL